MVMCGQSLKTNLPLARAGSALSLEQDRQPGRQTDRQPEGLERSRCSDEWRWEQRCQSQTLLQTQRCRSRIIAHESSSLIT